MLLISLLTLYTSLGSGYPSATDAVKDRRTVERQVLDAKPKFNPKLQHVSTTGVHAWQAPGPDDLRGPCPGLNAAANHGYIPRNGIATAKQAVAGLVAAYGIAVDLAELLANIAAYQAGDGISFSIGGPPPVELVAPSLLGHPQGISYAHNRFEGDNSPTRGDLYQFGNDYDLQMRFFKGLIDLPVKPEEPNYNLDILTTYAVTRLKQSISENPYFFRGPVGFLIPPGTLGLIFRLFGNKSEAYPEGFLDKSTIKSFFSVSGHDGNLVWKPGHERIPHNWYKRAIGDEYSTIDFGLDVRTLYRRNPEAIAFGGNTGKVKTFTGLDISNMTGGVYNGASLAEGNNLICFIYQSTASSTPDFLRRSGVIRNIGAAVKKINGSFAKALGSLACPKLTAFDESGFDIYPGYTKLRKSGRYPKHS